MSSLRNAIKLARAGHGTPELRRPLLLLGPILGLSARSMQLKYLSGTPVNRYEVQGLIGMAVALSAILWGLRLSCRHASAEAANIARAKGMCRRCLYPLAPDMARCPECGIDTPPPAEVRESER